MLTAVESRQLADLYGQHAEPLASWCRRRFGNVGDDAACEAWSIIARVGPGRIQPDTAQAYLRTVARHEALKLLVAGRQAPVSLDDDLIPVDVTDARADVPRQAQTRGELADLTAAIGLLSVGRRTAVIGRIVGLSYDEIGDTAGHPSDAPVNTWANRHVTEGRKQLRDHIDRDGRWGR